MRSGIFKNNIMKKIELQKLIKWAKAEEEKAINRSNRHAAQLEWTASHISFGNAEAFSSIVKKLNLFLKHDTKATPESCHCANTNVRRSLPT